MAPNIWSSQRYYLYTNTKGIKGDDRPLPYELKKRVNEYIGKRMSDPIEYKRNIETSSSFNALIRKEIKSGNLQ